MKKKLTNTQKTKIDSVMSKCKGSHKKLGTLKIIGEEMKKGKPFKKAIKRVKGK